MSNEKKLYTYTIEEKNALKIDKNLLKRYLNINLSLTIPDLTDKLRSGRITGLEAGIISVLLKAIQEGDANRLDSLLTRVVGKAPVTIEDDAQDELDGKSLDDLLAMKKELDKRNQITIKRIENNRQNDE